MNADLLTEVLKYFSGESLTFGTICFVAGFFTAVSYYESRTKAFKKNLDIMEASLKEALNREQEKLKEREHEDLLGDVLNKPPT